MNNNLILRVGIIVLRINSDLIAHFSGSLMLVSIMRMAGLHLGLCQALVANRVLAHTTHRLRGLVFSIYELIMHVAVWVATYVAGCLAEQLGIQCVCLRVLCIQWNSGSCAYSVDSAVYVKNRPVCNGIQQCVLFKYK